VVINHRRRFEAEYCFKPPPENGRKSGFREAAPWQSIIAAGLRQNIVSSPLGKWPQGGFREVTPW